MPVLPDTTGDEMYCPNPRCNGIALLEKGGHNQHGKSEWWVRRWRECPKCRWRFETEERIRGQIQKPIPGLISIDRTNVASEHEKTVTCD